MAITESRGTQPGSGEPPLTGRIGSRRHGPWRRWVVIGAAALLATAVVVLAALAGTYQPVQSGGVTGGSFPGLPPGVGIGQVNTFAFEPGQIYVPPQLGTFTITESIENAGPEAVTIDAVSILSPEQQAQHQHGVPLWPLAPAGPVQWALDSFNARQPQHPTSGSVAGPSLAPNEYVRIAIPVRLTGTCYDPNGWTGADTFYVKERFLFFTHWVAVPFQIPWIFHEPFNPGVQPAKEFVCLTK